MSISYEAVRAFEDKNREARVLFAKRPRIFD
jgi:hypothetical protein